jgi:hypothetical protein
MVTTVFWVAVICSFINFVLVLFVLPESLDNEKREYDIRTENANVIAGAAEEGSNARNGVDHSSRSDGIVCGVLKPLGVFLPVVVMDGGVRKRRDWSLTLLAAALFGVMLSQVSIFILPWS